MTSTHAIKCLERALELGTTHDCMWSYDFYIGNFNHLERLYNTVQSKLKEFEVDSDCVSIAMDHDYNEISVKITKARPLNAAEIAALQEQIATLQKADEEYEAFQKWKKEIGL